MCVCLYVLIQIYQNLSTVNNMNVYKKQEIPDRFHYKNGRFVSTLTLVAQPGWFITEVSEAILHTICPECHHGYLCECFMIITVKPNLDVAIDAIIVFIESIKNILSLPVLICIIETRSRVIEQIAPCGNFLTLTCDLFNMLLNTFSSKSADRNCISHDSVLHIKPKHNNLPLVCLPDIMQIISVMRH